MTFFVGGDPPVFHFLYLFPYVTVIAALVGGWFGGRSQSILVLSTVVGVSVVILTVAGFVGYEEFRRASEKRTSQGLAFASIERLRARGFPSLPYESVWGNAAGMEEIVTLEMGRSPAIVQTVESAFKDWERLQYSTSAQYMRQNSDGRVDRAILEWLGGRYILSMTVEDQEEYRTSLARRFAEFAFAGDWVHADMLLDSNGRRAVRPKGRVGAPQEVTNFRVLLTEQDRAVYLFNPPSSNDPWLAAILVREGGSWAVHDFAFESKPEFKFDDGMGEVLLVSHEGVGSIKTGATAAPRP